MPDVLRNTPLIALSGVALDTETTGLDTRTARIVEIGAASFGADAREFQSLVDPGLPVPAASSKVHGIDDAMLKGAPAFAAVWPQAEAFIGDRLLLGHSLGFDLAVIQKECARAGLPAPSPRLWLDTRFLAILLNARLPDFSLGTLAAWLGVEGLANHRALGDARATIIVFQAMIPRLADIGVHTVGEAVAACRKLEQLNDELARAGWSEAPRLTQPVDERKGGERTDTYPYRHRVAELMSAPPRFAGGETPLWDALKTMAETRISSLYVGDPAAPAAEVGIVTERDLLRAIAREGAAAFQRPIGEIASRPLATIPAGAYAYRAIGRMARLNIRHLAVVDETSGRVAGALSQRDLLRLRAGAAVVLGDDVDEAGDVAALARAWAKLPAMARALTEESVPAVDVAGVIARELGALTRRAAVFAEAEMEQAGFGRAPRPYAVLVLGSAGRGESLLAMDQDNAVVFSEGEPDGPADRWFADFGKRMCAILHKVGVPLCPGGVMASEPAFRGSVETWRERMRLWLARSRPEDMLNVDIVFDARTVHGDPALAGGLLADFRAAARDNPAFLKLMAASHGAGAVPTTLFGKLKGDAEGRIDLKKHLISRTVAAARVLALRHGVAEGRTVARLEGLLAKRAGSASDIAGLRDGFVHGLGFVLKAQLADIAEGRKPTNRVPLALIGDADQARLKADIQRLGDLEEIVRDALY